MADYPTASGGRSRHLDATGPREVVYCHQCDNEWYHDTHGLECPNCAGEITEIITPESDPRPGLDRPPTPPDFTALQNHNPWGDNDVSDPEEADIEEHITHGPGGSVMFTQTVRRSAPRHGSNRQRAEITPDSQRIEITPDNPDNVLREFQNMIGSLMGPQLRHGQAGRSGPETLFTTGPFGGGFRMRGEPGPQVVGGRFTFTTTTGGGSTPRDAERPQPEGAGADEMFSLLRGLFATHAPLDTATQGMPPGLASLFATMLPANLRSGDAVYSQEALDQIISTLMEQHPTSNAPGPASAEAISALPKQKLDEKLLGPEGKGECSVCMDDVYIGDEVVALPCSHWFHEICAGAWLSEHNTCPICRKGIDCEASPTPNSSSRRSSQSGTASRNEHRARRQSATRPRLSRDNTVNNRNEARLDAIRQSARLSTPNEENEGPTRWQIVGGSNISTHGDEDYNRMPGSFRRPTEISENQRDGRRGHTSRSSSSRDSRRSSTSGSGGTNGGALSWLRDRWGSGSGQRRQD